MEKPYIVFDITPDGNIDYTYHSVKDHSMVSQIKCHPDDPMPIEIPGKKYAYVYRAYDLDLNEHRLIHNGIPHRLLGRLSVG